MMMMMVMMMTLMVMMMMMVMMVMMLDAVTLAIACECPLDRAGLSITKHTTRTRSMNKFSITHSRVWTRGAIIPVIISNFSIDRQFIYLSNLFFY